MLYNLMFGNWGNWPLGVLYSIAAILYGLGAAVREREKDGGSYSPHSRSFWIATWITYTLFFPLVFAIRLLIALGKRVQKRQREKRKAEYTAKKKKWMDKNPVVLYYNTMNGIVAVLRKEDYENSVRETERNRINGFWKHNFLQPHPGTALFIHASARESVPEAYRAGWISDWVDIQQKTRFAHMKDIFVPFSSDILTIESQLERIMKVSSHNGVLYLVDPRVPDNL